MKPKILFATIPVDYPYRSSEERRASWAQIVTLLRLEDFPVQRLHLFVNPGNRHNVKLFYRELKSAAPHVRLKFIIVRTEKNFSIATFMNSYGFFCDWFCRYRFDTERYDYFFYFSRGNLFVHAFMITVLINLHKLPCGILHLRRNLEGNGPEWQAQPYDAHIGKWIADISRYERRRCDAQTLLKSSIPTCNARFNRLIRDIEHVALHSSAPVLLLGPTGSGKSQLARRIYELRRRVGRIRGDFVSLNCATLEPASAHSTLFGHVKGAFTGAAGARKGLLKMADGGVLFLDEVGELAPDMQARLLKALEERSYLPLGSDTEVRSDFQLICATNRNLQEAVRSGAFRQDLLARIDLWSFELPGLAERKEDIAPNIDFELGRLREEMGLFVDFTPSARQRYQNFAVSPEATWPENFRTLMSSVERMATYSLHGVIDDEIVERELELLRSRWREGAAPATATAPPSGDETRFPLQAALAARGLLPPLSERDLFDAAQLEEVLAVCRESATRSEAGRRLFACSRQRKGRTDDTARLNKYLKSRGLDWEALEILRPRGQAAEPSEKNL